MRLSPAAHQDRGSARRSYLRAREHRSAPAAALGYAVVRARPVDALAPPALGLCARAGGSGAAARGSRGSRRAGGSGGGAADAPRARGHRGARARGRTRVGRGHRSLGRAALDHLRRRALVPRRDPRALALPHARPGRGPARVRRRARPARWHVTRRAAWAALSVVLFASAPARADDDPLERGPEVGLSLDLSAALGLDDETLA